MFSKTATNFTPKGLYYPWDKFKSILHENSSLEISGIASTEDMAEVLKP